MGAEAGVYTSFQEALLKASISSRPVLLRLNADTSFLISLPYPAGLVQSHGRCRYNVLVDPWLQGPQSDVASWFSTQWHAIESSVRTIKELNAILRIAETRCLSLDEYQRPKEGSNYIDVVVISHEFTDHCHEATLRELDQSVPVFATAKAVELITHWKHFDNVYNMASFKSGINWRTTSTGAIPAWIGLSRLITEGNSLYYHSAIVICIQRADTEGADAIIYTPHGVESASFAAISSAKPHVEVLAFLHGLHDVSLKWTKQLNLGALNALRAQQLLKAKYWVATHDEVKRGGGMIKPILQRKAYTLADALAQARKDSNAEVGATTQGIEDMAFVDLSNGQSLVLVLEALNLVLANRYPGTWISVS